MARINIIYGMYGYDFVDEFTPLSDKCGVVYEDVKQGEKKYTQVQAFFTESENYEIPIATPECECLDH
jgi:hypothetical protein